MRALLAPALIALLLACAAPAAAQDPGSAGGVQLAQEGSGSEGGSSSGGSSSGGGSSEGGSSGGGSSEGGSSGGGSSGEEDGSFLVSPSLGLMIWTVVAFGITLLILRKAAFPRIAEALDKRRRTIEESIDAAERTRREADELLSEYRSRLTEARGQAEEIVARARKAGDRAEGDSKERAKEEREEMLQRARREIESETQRALNEIRKEVADLTVQATERVTRKSLDSDDHRRLIDEALSDLDFESLAKDGGDGASGAPASETEGSPR